MATKKTVKKEEKVTLGLSTPWVTFFKKVHAFFKDDPEIKLTFNNDIPEIKFYVENPKKAAALESLLPVSKEFGNVSVKITVVPANVNFGSYSDKISAAFENNPVLSFVKNVDTIFGHYDYIVFKNEVVQFFNDNMGDIYGNTSTLYQDIASDIFETEPTVRFCTDTKTDE